jgi:hypothetical protein
MSVLPPVSGRSINSSVMRDMGRDASAIGTEKSADKAASDGLAHTKSHSEITKFVRTGIKEGHAPRSSPELLSQLLGTPQKSFAKSAGTQPESQMWGKNFQVVSGEGTHLQTHHSNGFKQHVEGDSRNGMSASQEAGAWSDSGTKRVKNGLGGEVGAFGQGAVGYQADGAFSKTLGQRASVDAKGSAWTGAQGRASAQAGASLDSGMYGKVGVEGRVGAGVTGEAQTHFGPHGAGQVGATGSAMAGAETSNGVFAGAMVISDSEKAAGLKSKVGLDASAGGFAGAKAEGAVSGGIGGSTVGVTGTAIAGVGAEAKFHASLEEGKDGKNYLSIGGKAGVAVGVGAELEGGVHINVTPLVTLAEMGHDVGEALASEIKKEVAPVAHKIEHAVEHVVGEVKDDIKNGAKIAGDKVKDVASKLNPFD